MVPEATPETMPELEPMVATVASLLVHEPPPASLRVVVDPAHTKAVPLIADGVAITAITVVAAQPVDSVYVIVVVPDATPDAIPDVDPTVATVPSLLAQVPPPPSLNAIVEPAQTLLAPLMADGNGLTVATEPAEHPLDSV